jgi:hypothetical protein
MYFTQKGDKILRRKREGKIEERMMLKSINNKLTHTRMHWKSNQLNWQDFFTF